MKSTPPKYYIKSSNTTIPFDDIYDIIKNTRVENLITNLSYFAFNDSFIIIYEYPTIDSRHRSSAGLSLDLKVMNKHLADLIYYQLDENEKDYLPMNLLDVIQLYLDYYIGKYNLKFEEFTPNFMEFMAELNMIELID